jgi:hypothetical protein
MVMRTNPLIAGLAQIEFGGDDVLVIAVQRPSERVTVTIDDQ